MNDAKIREYGSELHLALRNRKAVEPLTDREPEITIEDAYRIQLEIIEKRKSEGERVVGKKIGVTSKAVQTMLNVDQPDFGHLMSGMAFGDGDELPTHELLQPRAEGEIAFILCRTLVGPGVTNADVLRATECVMPCFEIVDSRIEDWRIRIQDTVADNASSGLFVLGSQAVSPRSTDLRLCGLVLEKNGVLEATGAGAAALGSPVNSVAWLANTLGAFGIALEAGEVILSGSLVPLIPASPGDHMRVSIGGIGSVSVRFSALEAGEQSQ
jgi:2-oxopent-4-enoate/cis-2-oxohex-4-enoate hydratase